MRIRTKFFFLQFLIVAGFLLSIGFVILRFLQVYNLKELELRGVESMTDLINLEQKTDLFSRRNEPLTLLWEDWIESYLRFDATYVEMLNSPYHGLLGSRAVTGRDARLEAWTAIRELEIEPLINNIELTSTEDVLPVSASLGIRTSRELIGNLIGYDSTEAIRLAEIDSRFSNVRESLVASISIPTMNFIRDLRALLDEFISQLVVTTLIIALLIQVFGAAIAFLFSRRFGSNVVLVEQTLANVAGGNFNAHLDLRSGDEFQNIAEHFNLLTTDLWNRIESMKDMMRDIGSATGEDTDIEVLEEFMLELAIDNTGADAGLLIGVLDGMLVLKNIQGYFPPPMPLPPMVSSKRDYVTEWFKSHRIAPGEGFLGRLTANGEPRFIRDNRDGELPDNADRETDLYINSAIFIPLTVSGVTLGILGLALTRRDSVFTDLDYAYMRSYGDFIALTMDNLNKYMTLLKSHQVNREIEVAADIQRALLPEKLPNISGVEVAAFSDPAKGVSGDYYDVFELGSGKTAIVICDVAGKGVPASLLMIMIRTIIRSISSPDKQADRIMTELNRAITGRLGAGRFATISLVIVDTVRNVVSYANGGHHPMFILRGDTGRYHMFDADGLPLGIDRTSNYEHKMIRVRKGDSLILFTDGIPEARSPDGQELTTERLLRVVARYADQPPREVARRVKDYVNDFTSGNRQDDQTFMVLKVV